MQRRMLRRLQRRLRRDLPCAVPRNLAGTALRGIRTAAQRRRRMQCFLPRPRQHSRLVHAGRGARSGIPKRGIGSASGRHHASEPARASPRRARARAARDRRRAGHRAGRRVATQNRRQRRSARSCLHRRFDERDRARIGQHPRQRSSERQRFGKNWGIWLSCGSAHMSSNGTERRRRRTDAQARSPQQAGSF